MLRRDGYRADSAADRKAAVMTGEQQTRATGIAYTSGCGAGIRAGAGVAAAFLSSANRCRNGSRTTVRITPSPSSAADTAKPSSRHRLRGRGTRAPPAGPSLADRPVGAENLCHLGRCPSDRGRFGRAARRRPGRSWLGRRWDDLRLMGLKLVFLVVSRLMSLLRLPRRESWWKDAEILMLRHQLAVAERERPKARARLA